MGVIAELKSLATLDGAQFRGEVDKIGSRVEKFGSQQLAGLKGIISGAFSIGALVSFGRTLLNTADNLVTGARTIGITTESIIRLKTAMAESGIKAEDMLRILSKLPDAQARIIEGNKTMEAGIAALGISQQDFISMAPDDLLERIAEGYVKASGSAEAFGAVVDIFGQSIGPQMIEVLERINGNGGLQGFADGASDAAKGIEELARAKDSIESFFNTIIIWSGKAVSWISKVAGKMGEIVERERTWGPISTPFKAFGELYYSKKYNQDILNESKIPKSKSAEEILAEKKAELNKKALEDRIKKEKDAVDAKNKKEQDALNERLRKDAEASAKKLVEEARKKEEEARKKEELIEDVSGRERGFVEDYIERRDEILAGKGLSTPSFARIDAMQAVGGLIGRAGGRGDQQARMAERTAEATEKIEKLLQETNEKTNELRQQVAELMGV